MSSLEIKVEISGDQALAKLIGQINEDSDLSALENITAKTLILDLKEVSLINSCGIREWVEFQNQHFDFEQVIYENCPQVIIEQMNIVAGFIHKNGKIKSFYAPYFNEFTDEEVKILLTPQEVVDGKAPVKKDAEDRELEFDEIEAQYFNFLNK